MTIASKWQVLVALGLVANPCEEDRPCEVAYTVTHKIIANCDAYRIDKALCGDNNWSLICSGSTGGVLAICVFPRPLVEVACEGESSLCHDEYRFCDSLDTNCFDSLSVVSSCSACSDE